MERPELSKDDRFVNFIVRNENEPALKQLIEEWTRKYPTDTLMQKLIANGVPGAPVNNVKQVIEHPHTKARGMIVDIDQPGAGIIQIFGPALKAMNNLVKIRGAAPGLGVDNRMILEKVLGKSSQEIESILTSGVMG